MEVMKERLMSQSNESHCVMWVVDNWDWQSVQKTLSIFCPGAEWEEAETKWDMSNEDEWVIEAHNNIGGPKSAETSSTPEIIKCTMQKGRGFKI